MIKRYTKKPVTIEAVQFDGTLASVENFTGLAVIQELTSDTVQIETLEGVMTASPGDWIIKGVKGEFYPCKPDIFAATYSEGEDAAKLQSERDALAAEVDGLRADAERYRWLLNSLFVRWFRVGDAEIGMRAYETEPSPEEITAAIDAARTTGGEWHE